MDASDRRAIPEDALLWQPEDGQGLGISRAKAQRLMWVMGSEAWHNRPSACGPGTPEIFNPDQAVQYTARAFAGRLEQAGVAVAQAVSLWHAAAIGRTTCPRSDCGGR